MVFIETSFYSRIIADYLSDEEQSKLAAHLIDYPGGIRKIRWGAKGKGKRGGVRVIYYWRRSQHHIYLLNIYGKNEASDLTEKEKDYLKKLVEAWKQ
jgi:hypothetical protein